MELKTSKELESSAYRCLFEYVKKEGVEPALSLAKDINDFYCDRDILIKRAIVFGENDLIKIVRRNRDIVKYLRERKEDIKNLNLVSEDVLSILTKLQEDNTLINLYLENIRRLEDIKVSRIGFIQFPRFAEYYCGIYRDKDGQIINIQKNYIDGKITEVQEEILTDEMFNYSEIHYKKDNKETTFSLNVENTERGYSHRNIIIKDFGFNGEKLPSEEEISSYEIPIQLIKK